MRRALYRLFPTRDVATSMWRIVRRMATPAYMHAALHTRLATQKTRLSLLNWNDKTDCRCDAYPLLLYTYSERFPVYFYCARCFGMLTVRPLLQPDDIVYSWAQHAFGVVRWLATWPPHQNSWPFPRLLYDVEFANAQHYYVEQCDMTRIVNAHHLARVRQTVLTVRPKRKKAT